MTRTLAWAILVGGFALIASMSNARGDSIHINQGGQSSPAANTSRATAHATSSASAKASAQSRSSSQAFGGHAVGKGGQATATTGSAYGGQASGYGSGGSVSTHERVIIAPGLAGLTGSPCMGSTTASVGVPVFSAGVGTTWEDEQCTLRENLKVVAQFDPVVAREMLADLKGVREAHKRMGVQTSYTERPDWCDGKDLRTASAYDQEMCQ